MPVIMIRKVCWSAVVNPTVEIARRVRERRAINAAVVKNPNHLRHLPPLHLHLHHRAAKVKRKAIPRHQAAKAREKARKATVMAMIVRAAALLRAHFRLQHRHEIRPNLPPDLQRQVQRNILREGLPEIRLDRQRRVQPSRLRYHQRRIPPNLRLYRQRRVQPNLLLYRRRKVPPSCRLAHHLMGCHWLFYRRALKVLSVCKIIIGSARHVYWSVRAYQRQRWQFSNVFF